MWVARTGPYEPNSIVIFEYKRGRDHQYAYEITENCDAIIQSDGHEAYDKLPNINLNDEEGLDKIMPWSIDISEEIKSPKKA